MGNFLEPSAFSLLGSRGPNGTPGIFQIADMVAKGHAFHATFNVHRGFSDINLDLGPLGPSSRESTEERCTEMRIPASKW